MQEINLTTLINNINGIAYRCKNDENWTMEYMSPTVQDLTGYREKEIINNRNLSYSDLILEEDRPLVWKTVQGALERKGPFQMEYRIRIKSGEIRYVWEQGVGVYDEKGVLLSLEGYITDITEKKRNQLGLEKVIKEKVKELELSHIELIKQERSKFLNLMIMGLAHQLRNPLNLAMNAEGLLSKLLAEGENQKEAEELKTLLGIIEKGHNRIDEIIDSIFSLSDVDNEKREFHTLKELCERAINLSSMGHKDLRNLVSVELDDETLELNCYPASFIQFLITLILNSLNAIEKKEFGKTERPAIVIKFQYMPKAMLIVWDNGVGIKQEDLEKVTNPFFTTDSIGSKGLGLTFGQEIMRAHGFTMEINSKNGESTEVRVHIPEQSWRFE